MPIIVAEQLGEIVLLEENADEDVGCRHRRKQQVSDRHRWRRPERDYEAEINRMPHEVVPFQHRGDRLVSLPAAAWGTSRSFR